MVLIGMKVKTGEKAPTTGRYECLTHRKRNRLLSIANTIGDPMPPCPVHGAVWWELIHLD